MNKMKPSSLGSNKYQSLYVPDHASVGEQFDYNRRAFMERAKAAALNAATCARVERVINSYRCGDDDAVGHVELWDHGVIAVWGGRSDLVALLASNPVEVAFVVQFRNDLTKAYKERRKRLQTAAA